MLDGLSTLFQSFADLLNPMVDFLIWIFPIKIYRLHDGELGVILTFGKTRKWRRHSAKPGLVFCFACETLKKRQALGKYCDMADQVLYSKDGQAMVVNLAMTYEIVDPIAALLHVENIDDMLPGVVMDHAREYVRTKTMSTIVQRKNMSSEIVKNINESVAQWGVCVKELFITDLRPHQIMLIGEILEKLNKAGLNIKLDGGVKEICTEKTISKDS